MVHVTAEIFLGMWSNIACAVKISFPAFGVMKTHQVICHYSESPLKAANKLSCGETSSSRSSCLTEESYCAQVWVPVLHPFRRLPAIPGLLQAWFTSGERGWLDIDQSRKLCELVLIILHELYQVPVPSSRGVITVVYCQSSVCSWSSLVRKGVPKA